MFVEIDGVLVEVPRHIHKYGGVSLIVETEEALRAALDSGWVIDPNTALPPPVATPDDASDESSEPDAPVKRGPGRPRKVPHDGA